MLDQGQTKISGQQEMGASNLFELLGLGGTGCAVTLSVLGLFWNADKAFSEEFRLALSKQLQRLKIDTEGVNWPRAFAGVFDRIFGERHLTWICFFRSAIASAACYFIIAAVMLSLIELDPAGQSTQTKADIFYVLLVAFVLVGLTVNTLADYISLMETRYLINKMIKRPSKTFIVLALIADAVFTTAIYAISLTLVVFVLLDVANYIIDDIAHSTLGIDRNIVDFVLFGQKFEGFFLVLIITFATTLFTSVWVWLCLLGWGFVRNAARFQTLLQALQFALPIKTSPMRAIGEIAATATALVFVALSLFSFEA